MKTSVGWHKKIVVVITMLCITAISAITMADVSSLGEFQVNTTWDKSELNPDVARLNDGGFVITWTKNSNQNVDWDLNLTDVYAQRYDANGFQIGSEFLVNTATAGPQKAATVAALADGGFVIAWHSTSTSTSLSGTTSTTRYIYGQRYDASGVPVGEQIPIAATGAANPIIAGLHNGGFVVSFRAGTNHQSVRIVGADGTLGNIINIGSQNASIYRSAIAVLSDDRMLVTWTSLDDPNYGVYGRFLNASGTAVSDVFAVGVGAGTQYMPDAAAFSDDSTIVVWYDMGEVYGQRYNSDGASIGGRFQLNTYTTDAQNFPAVTNLGNDGFFASWMSAVGTPTQEHHLRGQLFDANGVMQGGEMILTTDTTPSTYPNATIGAQHDPHLALLNNGNVVLTYDSINQDGYLGGIFAQILSGGAPSATPLPTSTPTPTVTPTPTQTDINVSGVLKIDASLRSLKSTAVTIVGSAGASCTTTVSRSTYAYTCTLTSGSGQVAIGNYSLGTAIGKNNKVCAPVTAPVGVESGSGVSEATVYVFNGMSAGQTVNFIIKKQQASCGAGYR